MFTWALKIDFSIQDYLSENKNGAYYYTRIQVIR